MRRSGNALVCLTSLEIMIACNRLQWLGNVAQMDDLCLPKQFLLGWLFHPLYVHGIKLQWRDKVRRVFKERLVYFDS